MKKAFYFTLKFIAKFKIFKILSWRFGHVGKGLERKRSLYLKFYDVRQGSK